MPQSHLQADFIRLADAMANHSEWPVSRLKAIFNRPQIPPKLSLDVIAAIKIIAKQSIDIVDLNRILFDIIAVNLIGFDGPFELLEALYRSDLDQRELDDLMTGVRNQRTLALHYYSLQSNETTLRKVDPYQWKMYDGQAYLIGYCHKHQALRTFLLGRMKAVALTPDDFTRKPDLNVRARLKDALGIYLGTEGPRRIQIKCENSLLPILKANPIHESQNIELTSTEFFTLQLFLVETDDLVRRLLTYGDKMQILYPDTLQKKVSAMAHAILKRYQ